MSGASAGPSPGELRRAAALLDQIAADANRSASQIAGVAAGLRNLPGQVEAAIAGTATHVDQQIVSELSRCGKDIADAEGSLRATATQANRSAEVAKAQADRAEREQAERSRSSRR